MEDFQDSTDFIPFFGNISETRALIHVLKTVSIYKKYKHFDINDLSNFDRSSRFVLGFTDVDQTVSLVRKLRGEPIYWDGSFITVVSNSSELQTLLETSLVCENELHKYGETYSHMAVCRGNLVQLLECFTKAEKMNRTTWHYILHDGVLSKIKQDLSNINRIDLQNIIQGLSKVRFSPKIDHNYRSEVAQIKDSISSLKNDDLPVNSKMALISEIRQLLEKINLD